MYILGQPFHSEVGSVALSLESRQTGNSHVTSNVAEVMWRDC